MEGTTQSPREVRTSSTCSLFSWPREKLLVVILICSCPSEWFHGWYLWDIPLEWPCFHTVQQTLPSYCSCIGVQLPHQVESCSLISKQEGWAAGQQSWVNYNSKCGWASRPRERHRHWNNRIKKKLTQLGYNFSFLLDFRRETIF